MKFDFINVFQLFLNKVFNFLCDAEGYLSDVGFQPFLNTILSPMQIVCIGDKRKLVQQSKPPERLRYRSLLFGRTADLIGEFLAPAFPHRKSVFPFDKSDLGR